MRIYRGRALDAQDDTARRQKIRVIRRAPLDVQIRREHRRRRRVLVELFVLVALVAGVVGYVVGSAS